MQQRDNQTLLQMILYGCQLCVCDPIKFLKVVYSSDNNLPLAENFTAPEETPGYSPFYSSALPDGHNKTNGRSALFFAFGIPPQTKQNLRALRPLNRFKSKRPDDRQQPHSTTDILQLSYSLQFPHFNWLPCSRKMTADEDPLSLRQIISRFSLNSF